MTKTQITGISWMEMCLIEEHGRSKWNGMNTQEQILHLAYFGSDLKGAFNYIAELRNPTKKNKINQDENI